MIILVGASASGKTELAKILYQNFGYQKCITSTTRNPRIHENDGIDYHFLSVDAFKKLEQDNQFVEVTQYQNQFYGIQKKDVKKDGIVILDPSGANTLIHKLKDQVFLVYVEAKEEIRRIRMQERKDKKEVIENRILGDRLVFNEKSLERIDLIIINETDSLLNQANLVNQEYQSYIASKLSKKR
jgi:guanylate kinase